MRCCGCCFSGNTTGRTSPFICRFFKRKQKGKGKSGAYLMFSPALSLFLFFSLRNCLSLYLPFISALLALLAGRVSGRQSLSPSLWCFCRLQKGLWSHCTPRCQGLRRAHAICQIDGKVAEWGLRHPSVDPHFLSFMCHIWMSATPL